MKKILFLLLLCASFAHAQDSATVNTRQGVPVFVFAKPLRPYEVLRRIDNTDYQDAANSITDALNDTKTVRCKSLSESLDILVTEADRLRSKKKNPVLFDAIITDDGTTGALIKWK